MSARFLECMPVVRKVRPCQLASVHVDSKNLMWTFQLLYNEISLQMPRSFHFWNRWPWGWKIKSDYKNTSFSLLILYVIAIIRENLSHSILEWPWKISSIYVVGLNVCYADQALDALFDFKAWALRKIYFFWHFGSWNGWGKHPRIDFTHHCLTALFFYTKASLQTEKLRHHPSNSLVSTHGLPG